MLGQALGMPNLQLDQAGLSAVQAFIVQMQTLAPDQFSLVPPPQSEMSISQNSAQGLPPNEAAFSHDPDLSQGSSQHHVGNNHPQNLGPTGAIMAQMPTGTFAQASSSSVSHIQTPSLSFAGGSSQLDLIPAFQLSLSALSHLASDPMDIPQESRALLLSGRRATKKWRNWEKKRVVYGILGPHVSEERCLQLMSSPQTPRESEPVLQEWIDVRDNAH